MLRSPICISLLFASCNAFTIPLQTVRSDSQLSVQPVAPGKPSIAGIHVRGGAVSASLSTSVLAGAYAIPATAGIAAVAGTLAYVRQAYIFSLSYGLSMLGIGVAALLTSPASLLVRVHAGLIAAYGLRLFAFLFWRQQLQPAYDGMAKLRALDKTPRLQRTPIILSTAYFYSLLSSSLIFHLQSAPLVGGAASLSVAGLALATIGLVYEAVADQQKSLFKMALRRDGKPDELYKGGLYASSRHANYLGEMVFWLGSFIAGVPAIFAPGVSLLSKALRAVSVSLGLAGIFFIMLSATKRLETRQAEKYRPSAAYDKYYMSTGALLPKLM